MLIRVYETSQKCCLFLTLKSYLRFCAWDDLCKQGKTYWSSDRSWVKIGLFLIRGVLFVSSACSCVKVEKCAMDPVDWSVADVVSYFTAAGFGEQAGAFKNQVSVCSADVGHVIHFGTNSTRGWMSPTGCCGRLDCCCCLPQEGSTHITIHIGMIIIIVGIRSSTVCSGPALQWRTEAHLFLSVLQYHAEVLWYGVFWVEI